MEMQKLLLITFVLFSAHWVASIFFQSILHHRGAAHNMYEFKNEFWKKLAYVGSFLTLGPSYMSAYTYGVFHRMHHAYADTDKDPHRPYGGTFGVFKTLWVTASRYREIFNGSDYITIDGVKVLVEDRFKKNVMDWPIFDAIFHNWWTRLVWVLLYFFFYQEVLGAPVWFAIILTVIHSIMGPIHGVIINYYAHKYGSRENDTADTSRNLPSFARFFLSLFGETLHNNHHAEPGNPDFSLQGRYGQKDHGFILFMKPLHKLGVIEIRDKKALA